MKPDFPFTIICVTLIGLCIVGITKQPHSPKPAVIERVVTNTVVIHHPVPESLANEYEHAVSNGFLSWEFIWRGKDLSINYVSSR